MGGLLHLVQRGGVGRDSSPPSPLLDVPNVTAHPSTGSVPIILLLCGLICLTRVNCGWNEMCLADSRSECRRNRECRRRRCRSVADHDVLLVHPTSTHQNIHLPVVSTTALCLQLPASSLLPATRRVLRYIGLSVAVFLSASLYVSKRGAYWDRLCRDVVGWLVVGCHARALWPNGAS